MKTALILHGMPSKKEYFDSRSPASSNKHWLPWLQRQLILGGILAQTPELPEPYRPVYDKWRLIFERFKVDQKTILVGHSCGAGFLVKWLSQNKTKVGKVALVAPFLHPSDNGIQTGLSNLKIDENLVKRTDGLMVFYSLDDEESVLTGVEKLRTKLKGARFRQFADHGHFCFEDMKTDQFPELRDFLLKN
ncbi:MAG: alpha/beta hydrolase [Candidatus Nealsonbacteria bacterium]|nr:alpha/beta hydrolase [Candidatus Nealsonbacteria bacterium]